ncbi:TAXI family TRAP transporter solute-binding subunit [Polynucleobacter sp. es-MAR-4]|uniref:TAXI family TRAP transporter solute-binding subunit n=1 Tax=Polynucleobacter sp. es-MAR-4 TaxID=1855655 RepID=UPI001C0C4366|nr:TAXI family TRAP transporter solute-binding subunit [Polynucleobacter sp. es-MAR-4]MBU3636078.1 hypothetical protein [Polynucleobacter sp. es-MAR-4]
MIHYIWLIARDEINSMLVSIYENIFLVTSLIFSIVGVVYWVGLIPPGKLLVATAGENSGYSRLVKLTQGEFKKSGIDIELRFTSGSLENIALLRNLGEGVDAALIQGGLDPKEEDLDEIVSLGSVGYEPVWIFYRNNLAQKPKQLKDFASLLVGVGPVEGGTQAIARKIFLAHNIEIDNKKNFKFDSYENNARDLKNGTLDAIIIVSPILSISVRDLLKSKEYDIFDFKYSEAYEKRFPFLQTVKIPIASLDFDLLIPPRDITLIATTTSLVVKKSLHPDTQILILSTLKKIFMESKVLFFSKRGEMPSYIDPTYSLSEPAKYFYENGLAFGLKHFPYRVAGIVDKIWLLLTAILFILYPLSRLNIGHRITRYHAENRIIYKRLFEIRAALYGVEQLSIGQIYDLKKILDEVNALMARHPVPVGAEFEMAVKASLIASLQSRIDEQLRQSKK